MAKFRFWTGLGYVYIHDKVNDDSVAIGRRAKSSGAGGVVNYGSAGGDITMVGNGGGEGGSTVEVIKSNSADGDMTIIRISKK